MEQEKIFKRQSETEVLANLQQNRRSYLQYLAMEESWQKRFMEICEGKKTLPMEDVMMDGQSLLVMDIIVELRNGALVLVEIQKIPYGFPAERASCYSSDLLLRQYTRVKSRRGNQKISCAVGFLCFLRRMWRKRRIFAGVIHGWKKYIERWQASVKIPRRC